MYSAYSVCGGFRRSKARAVDGVGETRTQNQPGTSREYSNWRVPLAGPDLKVVHTDEVVDLPQLQ